MTNKISRAEATLGNFKLRIGSDYGTTNNFDPDNLQEEIPDAPEDVNEFFLEGSRYFSDARDNSHPFADNEELDKAEEYFEEAFESYKSAVEAHLDHNKISDLVDTDLVIDAALSGHVDEESLLEAFNNSQHLVEDLESDQGHLRRTMEENDAYDFLENSSYDTEQVVEETYMQEVNRAEKLVDAGIEDIRQS